MEEVILQEVFENTSFTSSELTAIGANLKRFELKKGDLLLQKGQLVKNTHYVHNGCLRSFYIDQSGRDHTLQFAIKDWWISDYTAIFSTGEAMMNIECIQDSVLYLMSRKSMEQLYKTIPSFETYFRKKLERRMEAFHRRTLENLALPAKERYLSFLKSYPQVEQLVKNYHIASYLGITTESLSRIRKELTT